MGGRIITVWQVFYARKHVGWTEFDGELYRLAVTDFPFVISGCDDKFRWTGVSRLQCLSQGTYGRVIGPASKTEL